MKLLDLDLNLLKVFNQLMIDRRVSAAADALGVTQPAVSNALKRLRDLLDDELFTRSVHGMEPTPLAEKLAEPIAYALATISTAVNQQISFDPQTAKRNFRLGLTDIGEVFLLPELLESLQEEAPNVSFTTVRKSYANTKEDLESGNIELAIGLIPQLQAGFFRQQLMKTRYDFVFRREHPLAKKSDITLTDFCSYPHIVPIAADSGHSEIDILMARKGIRRDIRLTVPHFMAVGDVLSATNLVATLPSAFAEKIADRYGLANVKHPAALPEVSIYAYWHRKVHRDPGNQWLRRKIFELIGPQKA